MEQLLALSVRQPWAHAIVHLEKDIENRSRTLSHRGLTLIHASAGMTADEYEEAAGFIGAAVLKGIPHRHALDRGGIIGVVEIVDCVRASDSPWWMGPCGLVLRNARPLPFIPCKGTVCPLFWKPDAETQAKARAALRRNPNKS